MEVKHGRIRRENEMGSNVIIEMDRNDKKESLTLYKTEDTPPRQWKKAKFTLLG